jgi:cell division protein FtsL
MKSKVVKYPAHTPKQRNRKRKLIFWAFLCFLFIGGYLCLGQTFAFWETSSELQELQDKRDALHAENEALKEEILLLHNNDYIESQARKHLGMVKPGEIIFYVED